MQFDCGKQNDFRISECVTGLLYGNMSNVCVTCCVEREEKHFRILNLSNNQRDTVCNFCIFKSCSKCPIDSHTMRDMQKPLSEFQTKGFDKNKAQIFDSMCIPCFKFREAQPVKNTQRVAQVSSFGRFRNTLGVVSSPSPRPDGYVSVVIHHKRYYVHRT